MTQLEVMEKHSDIFVEYFSDDYNQMNSCMVWGLEVPSSWLQIIDKMLCVWESFSWKKIGVKKPQLVAEQVKEKFGELRFYYRMVPHNEGDDIKWYEDVFEGIICWAEYEIGGPRHVI